MADLRTFKDLKTLALTYLDQAGDINTGNQGDVLVGNAIAMQQNKRLTSQRWNFMLWGNPVIVNFQTGVRNYTLHPLAAMVTEFKNVTAGQQMNETPSRARYKIGVQDDRFHFEFVQESPVQLPFTSGVLTVVGSATISYVDTSGNYVVESISGGVTSAPVDTVVNVTKNDSNALTIRDVTNKVILALTSAQFSLSYPQIRLMADGVSGESATYRFYRRPRYLSLDNDIPEIPYPFSHILVYDALLELYTYNDATPPQWWVLQQADWERQLNQAYQEGEMEGAEVRTVIESDQYEG